MSTGTSEVTAQARIGIVDDHPAVMVGVATIVNHEPDMHVVATAASVSELIATGQSFDGVMLDLLLADGSTPTENITSLGSLNVPVLVYTSGDRPALVREAARAGAAGMVRKSEEPGEIVEAVRLVVRGEVAASADWAAAIESDPQFVPVQLSPREAEILGHYAAGETAVRVAQLLFISRETVLDHIRRIRVKYAAAKRPAPTKIDLYQRALEDGIVAPIPQI
ncbi:response regulator transcription factor [Gordonia jacobaea]|uniref:response regulator transcription factor n=1 Tax=Gordonia jacobaea TaxID=122202 RepID=UPI003D72F586